jgi:GT2 family glycosyltransferase
MKIGVVIVTYNRLEKLRKALQCFDDQVHQPEYIMVVNNASTDGTDEFLKEWSMVDPNAAGKRIVVTMESNTGGSGGFCEGLRHACEQEAEWVWVSDDDAYPERDALRIASDYLDNKTADERDHIAALCARVMNHGKPDPYHSRSFYLKGIRISEKFASGEDFQKKEFDKNCFSYVGAILSRKKLELAGLPNKDYFIYYDDTEHAMRMKQYGRIVCIPSILVEHDTPPEFTGLTWKDYYKYRNMTDMYRKHYPGIPFRYFAAKIQIKCLINRITGRRNLRWTILEEGYRDAMAGRFGLHKTYRPGWKAE